MLQFDDTYARPFLHAGELERMEPQVLLAHRMLEERTAAGSDYLGWLDLPVTYDREAYQRLRAAARRLRAQVRHPGRHWHRWLLSWYARSGGAAAGAVFFRKTGYRVLRPEPQPGLHGRTAGLAGDARCLGQCGEQIRDDDRTGCRVPVSPCLHGAKIRKGRRTIPHCGHNGPGTRRTEEPGRRGRIRDLCHPGRCRGDAIPF